MKAQLRLIISMMILITTMNLFTFGQDSNIIYYSNVSNNSKIIGAFDTFSLFILNDRISNQATLRIACQNSQPCPQIWNEISTNFKMSLVQVDFFYSDCLIGHFFDNYDGILAPSSVFAFTVRRNRYVPPKKSIRKEGYEVSDFMVVPLFPSQLIIDSGRLDQKIESLRREVDSRTNLILYSNDCKVSNLHDMSVLDSGRNFLNFSTEDISKIQRIRSIRLTGDWNLVDQVLIEKGIMNFSQNYESELVLWNSTCSDCSTSACMSYSDFTPLDFSNYTMFFVYVSFYAVFFAFGMFKRPSLKRRLLIPYLCPACAFLYTNLWTAPFRVTCATASSLASLFLFNFMCLIYALSIVRWIYLRNLYALIRKLDGNYTSILRRLASSSVGVVLVLFLTVIFSIVLLIPIIIIIILDSSKIFISFTLYIFIITLIGCFFALLCITVDMIINRKNIKEGGLAKFLLFDDPAYIRIDLMVFLAIVILLIIFIIITPNNSTAASSVNLAVRVAIALVMFFFYGGNAMIIEIYYSIRGFIRRRRYRATNQTEYTEITAIEAILIENKDVRELFREYTINESSYENYLLYEMLMITDYSKQITVEDMNNIFHTFIKSYAKFEVNISARARRAYLQFCMDVEEKNLPSEHVLYRQDILNILLPEIALNIYDTFSRLRRTKQYTEWKHIYELHKKEAVIVNGFDDL